MTYRSNENVLAEWRSLYLLRGIFRRHLFRLCDAQCKEKLMHMSLHVSEIWTYLNTKSGCNNATVLRPHAMHVVMCWYIDLSGGSPVHYPEYSQAVHSAIIYLCFMNAPLVSLIMAMQASANDHAYSTDQYNFETSTIQSGSCNFKVEGPWAIQFR